MASIVETHPHVAAQWHPTDNDELQARDVTYIYDDVVWWWCAKHSYEWEACIADRCFGHYQCKKCIDAKIVAIKVKKTGSIVETHPEIAKEWHPTKNGVLLPSMVSRGSSKKVWWQCSKDPTHEWETRVLNRCSQGRGCRCCLNQVTCATNNFASCSPELAKEWHPTKNLKPIEKYSKRSRLRVWWQCEKGHEWIISIKNRVDGNSKCPYCRGCKATEGGNTLYTPEYEHIWKEWHPTKNKHPPVTYTPQSSRLVWWMCEKGHEWKTTVQRRTSINTVCPECFQDQRTISNPLVVDNCKELLSEWHFIRNDKQPNFYSKYSTEKVWWMCAKGHEWQERIQHRTKKLAPCPYCSGVRPCNDGNTLYCSQYKHIF